MTDASPLQRDRPVTQTAFTTTDEMNSGLILVSRDLVEAMICVLRAFERTTGRVDNYKLSDMREELSANLAGRMRALPSLQDKDR